MAREGRPLNVIQRQPGHANLGTMSVYLQGTGTRLVRIGQRDNSIGVASSTAAWRQTR